MPVAITITRPTYTDVDSLPAATFNGVAISSAVVPDSTGSTEGVIRLAGDLTGTAASPALAASGVTAGAYGGSGANIPSITIDAKGRVTVAANRALTAADVGASATGHTHPSTDITGLGGMALNTLSVLSSTATHVTHTGSAGTALVFNTLNAPTLSLTTGKWLVIGTLPVRTNDVPDEVKLEFSDNGGSNTFGAGATTRTAITERRAMTVIGIKTVASGTFSVFMKATPGAAGGTLDLGCADDTAFAGTLLAIRLEGP